MDLSEYIRHYKLGTILENILFKDYNTIHLGGMVKYFFKPRSYKKLKKALNFFKKVGLEYYIVGAMSNTYTTGFNGVIISLDECKKKLKVKRKIYISANISCLKVSKYLAGLNIKSLLGITGIPGSIGGALYMNASVSTESISSYLLKVKVLDKNLKIKWIDKDSLVFNYRYSSFMLEDCIILEAIFKKVYDKNTKKLVQNILKKRRMSQPLGRSLGSIFKNGNNYYAGKIIEELGYKGYNYKGIEISLKHANIWLNKNGDIEAFLELIFIIKLRCLITYNIRLKEEIIAF